MGLIASAATFDVYGAIFILLSGLFGLFAGYMFGSIRIYMYLKKYYPEINFAQAPKERLRILAEREKRERAHEGAEGVRGAEKERQGGEGQKEEEVPKNKKE